MRQTLLPALFFKKKETGQVPLADYIFIHMFIYVKERGISTSSVHYEFTSASSHYHLPYTQELYVFSLLD
jgi:hypothetical protein